MPHEISMKFCCRERHKPVQIRNWCRNVWIMSLYINHSKRIFSVFRLKPHRISAFQTLCHLHLSTMSAEESDCAFNLFTSRFRCRGAVLGDRQKGGWPWQPLMSFDGRVAESSRVPHRSHPSFNYNYSNFASCQCNVENISSNVDGRLNFKKDVIRDWKWLSERWRHSTLEPLRVLLTYGW